MNPSTIPHTELSLRLTICAEFLLAEQKPIEELYERWKGNVGGQIVEFAEFEYWFKRFQNNQFDLGYDTSLDEKDNSEIGSKIDKLKDRSSEAENVAVIPSEIAPEDPKKTDKNFNIQNVSRFFQTLINRKTENIQRISLYLTEYSCSINFDNTNVQIEKYGDDWVVKYGEKGATITTDPEKSIIDHVWFVLKDPKLRLRSLGIQNRCIFESRLIDFGRLNVMLQEMFNNSFDHLLNISSLFINKFNEDTFISLLKHVKPKTLASISMEISWEGNYQKLKEIVETEQWKQARNICSIGDIPLSIDDVLHCKNVSLCCDKITSEDVVRVRDLFLKEPSNRLSYTLKTEQWNYDDIRNALQSKNLDPGIRSHHFDDEEKFYFQSSNHSLTVTLFPNEVVFRNH